MLSILLSPIGLLIAIFTFGDVMPYFREIWDPEDSRTLTTIRRSN